MLSLSRGLVLRRGDRQLEFERDLGDGRVQLKYMDNFEVCTMKVTDLLKQVYEGKLIPTTIPTRANQLEASEHVLPVSWTPAQLEVIEFRMQFVQAVLGSSARRISREQCAHAAAQVWGGSLTHQEPKAAHYPASNLLPGQPSSSGHEGT